MMLGKPALSSVFLPLIGDLNAEYGSDTLNSIRETPAAGQTFGFQGCCTMHCISESCAIDYNQRVLHLWWCKQPQLTPA